MVACPASPHEYIARLPQQGSGSEAAAGEVAEWSIAHAWKACLGLNLTRVRIPLSPPTPLAETLSAPVARPENPVILQGLPELAPHCTFQGTADFLAGRADAL